MLAWKRAGASLPNCRTLKGRESFSAIVKRFSWKIGRNRLPTL